LAQVAQQSDTEQQVVLARISLKVAQRKCETKTAVSVALVRAHSGRDRLAVQEQAG
jgi:hypothetical protein